MKTLHEIVNSILLEKGYPIHWYGQYLKYASAILRELLFDTLKITNTVIFDGDKEYPVPCDYMDWVRIGASICKDKNRSISLYNCDCNGNYDASGTYWRLGGHFGEWYYNDVRIENGLIKMRREGKVIFEYITDGSHIDNASKVHPYSQATIEQGCEWKNKQFNRSHHPNEARLEEMKFHSLHSRLRSRLNPMTTEDVRKVIRHAAATPFKG